MDFLNVSSYGTSALATKVLVLDGTTVKSRTAQEILTDGGGTSIPNGDKGDITVSGSGSTWTIDSGVVTNAKMANMAASTIKANVGGLSAAPQDATLSQVLDLVGSATRGDILYRNAGSWTRLPAGTSGQYLKTQGATGDPVWATVSATSGRTFQATLLAAQGTADPTTPNQIYINTQTTDYGWPHDGADNQANSLLKAYKVIIPFDPTNYRFSLVCAGPSQYSTGTNPSSGSFGVKFQYSTDNINWNNITTITLSGRSTGDFVTVSGSLTVGSSPVYIRTLQVNSLSPSQDGYIYVRSFIADFWN